MNDMRRTKELAVILLSLLLLTGMIPVQVFATAADNTEGSLSGDNSLSTLSLSAGTLSPEFQYNITDYTASVGADVSSVEVTTKTSNEYATVESISGNTDLQPGQNTISVIVKAQNGATATYKIVVTKGQGTQEDQPQSAEPSAEGTEASEEGQDGQQSQGGITINGHSFNLAATVPDDVVPQDFMKDTVTCQGQQVECLRFGKGTLTLVYLTTPSTEVKNMLAVYEEGSGIFYPFRRISQGEASYLIILNPPAETGLSQEYTQSAQPIGEFENVPAFVRADSAPKAGDGVGGLQGAEGAEAGSAPAESGFVLVYAASSFGNIGWYQYDMAEATFQRFLLTGGSSKDTEGTDQSEEEPSVEMQGLQNAYKDLEEKYNKKKDLSRKTTAVMIFVIAVLVIVIINLIIRSRKGNEEGEEVYDHDKPEARMRKRVQKAEEARHKEYEEGKRTGKKEEPQGESGIRKTSRSAMEESRMSSCKFMNADERANTGIRNPAADMGGTKRVVDAYHSGDHREGIGNGRGVRKAAGQEEARIEKSVRRTADAFEAPKMPKQPSIDDRKRDTKKAGLPSGGAFAPDSRPMAKQETMEDDFEVIDLEDL